MAQLLPLNRITLYIWPGRWNLPSIDPLCLAAVFYLQLAIPGKFCIAECTNPDLSPSGQLPFLAHEQHIVSPLGSIIKYVAGLRNINTDNTPNANIDASLSATEKSQKVAWCAHVESQLGDLVYYMIYSLHSNWAELTHPMLVSMLSFPQRYYVPSRIRNTYKPRLEAIGFWSLPENEKEEKRPFKEPMKDKDGANKSQKFKRTFQREKVLEKARSTFDIYERLLGDGNFFYNNRPTTLDILLAAHTLMLLRPSYPDPLLQTLVQDSYSTLVSHAHRVYAAFESSSSLIPTSLPPPFSFRTLISWPATRPKQSRATSDEDVHFARMRWGFTGLAIGCVTAYLAIVGSPIRFVLSIPGDGSEEEDEEDAGV